MINNRTLLITLAAGGSAAILLGAYGFQYLGDIPPCKLCHWQRWPHGTAVFIGLLALWLPGRTLPLLGACAALVTAGIGAYHSGVERGWWEGPSTCTSGPISGLSPDQLLDQIMSAPLVRCDEIPWELFGLSIANLNTIASLGFAVIWVLAARSANRN